MSALGFLSAISRSKGVKPATFYNRVRRGWDPVRAATEPVNSYNYENPIRKKIGSFTMMQQSEESLTVQREIAYGRAMAKQAEIDSARSVPQDRLHTYRAPAIKPPRRPTARMTEIFDHVRENPNSTAAQISVALGISTDTVRRTLAIYCNKNAVKRHRKNDVMPYRFEVAK